MMHSAAVIDIGTNSILFLLAEKRDDGRITSLVQHTENVRLGENLDASGRIGDPPLEKAIAVLKQYRHLAAIHHAEQILAVGTHLFRKAVNRKEVIQTLYKKTGIDVAVLEENEEAEWSHRGAIYGRSISGPVITADIGGGSTEVVLGLDGQILETRSFPLGAVSLTEQFFFYDPPDSHEMAEMEYYVFKTVDDQFGSILQKGKQLIAAGGTATTLAALDLELDRYDPEKVDGHVLSDASVIRQLYAMAKIDLNERKKQLLLDPKRADIIVAGTRILKEIMKAGSFCRVLISDRGLRFGMALREFVK